MERIKNSIAVLCRGKSLQYIDKVPLVDEYVIVNRFGDELEAPVIANRLKDETITQVLSLAPDEPKLMLERGHYKKFNITRLLLPYVDVDVPGAPPKIENKFGDDIVAYILDDHHKQYMFKRNERPDGDTRYAYSHPSSGLAGVAHAALDYDKKNIYIIGLDFYQAKYAYGLEFKDVEQSLKRGENPDMMRDFLTNFMSTQKDKSFTIITCSDYSCNLKNVNVFNI